MCIRTLNTKTDKADVLLNDENMETVDSTIFLAITL